MIVLHDPLYFKKKRKYQTIEMEIIDTKPYLEQPIFLNDSTSMFAKLMVDTGASHALVLNHDSDPRISIPPANIRAKLGRGLTGDIEGHLARINALEILDFQLKDVIVSFPDTEMFIDTLVFRGRNGSVGGEVLGKFNVVFDYFRGKLHLKKNFKFNAPFEYNMSGLEILAEGRDLDVFMIHSVQEGSRAAGAGVLAGDIIVELNGLGSDKLSLTRIYNILNAKEGKKITMIISRESKQIKTRFYLHRKI
jgi:hypothetical protein